MTLSHNFRPSLAAVAGIVVLAFALASTPAVADPTTFEGSFHWTGRDRTGDLRAVFTPTADDAWDVVFYFDWEDEPHVYTGTSEGSLVDGALSGKVQNENKEYNFMFSGRIGEGKFEGTHQMVDKDGAVHEMGTLRLEAE